MDIHVIHGLQLFLSGRRIVQTGQKKTVSFSGSELELPHADKKIIKKVK